MSRGSVGKLPSKNIINKSGNMKSIQRFFVIASISVRVFFKNIFGLKRHVFLVFFNDFDVLILKIKNIKNLF